ncbi:MAG: serine/threonine protein kinase [Bryobacterales bacterium]|nr:serine/threonine protein kinase [Bryobacterales bacterium]
MNGERWRQVEDLFNRALEIPLAERAAWVNEACAGDLELRAEVVSLLANDLTATSPLGKHVADAVVEFSDRPVARYAGPYELIGEIGRGGMGTVYQARRADQAYDAIVAVKLVRPGMDTDFVLSRFRRERQTLARLTHPNIARLLDGGNTADGVPYIVMEYIDGVRITEYCQRERFTLAQRLGLFLPVCLAVDYAHRNFVVHRDIKPGNILVDSTGTPKLLDFGICKLLHANPLEDAEAMTREMNMVTPDYASPEQIQGEAISARSDVYSLGAVLYELLTGRRPHRFDKLTPVAIEAAICRSTIMTPSEAAPEAAARALRGDLDNIVLRALEKDPERRYESAAALAQDLQRYLDHVPVAARPATAWYRMGKFLTRHKLLVASVGAVLAASMIGTVVSVRQARRAESRERQVRSLARTFLYDVHDSIRDLPGATATRQKVVTTAVSYLDALAAEGARDPELLRELASGYQRIADLQGSDAVAHLGDARASLASYEKAVLYWDRLLAQQPRDLPAVIGKLTSLRRSGDLLTRLTGTREALAVYGQAEKAGREWLKVHPRDKELRGMMVEILAASARRSREVSDLTKSLATGKDALAIAEELSRDFPQDREILSSVSSSEAAVGMTLARLGNLSEAMPLYRRAVARNEQLLVAQPASVGARRILMISYSHLGDTLGHPDLPNLGDPVGAEAVYAKMAELGRTLYENDAKDARAASDYAIALMRWAAVTPAPDLREERLQRSLGLIRGLLAAKPDNLTLIMYEAMVEQQMGTLRESAGRPGEALLHWRRSLETARPYVGKGVTAMARVVINVARFLAPREPDRAAGLAVAALALSVAEKSAGQAKDATDVPARVLLPRAYSAYARFHARWGEAAQAAQWRTRAIDAWRALSPHSGFVDQDRRDLKEMELWKP